MEDGPIQRAIEIAGGSEAKLAEAIGFTQPAINKAKRSGRTGPRLALAIHHFTKGVVPASELRPDLWTKPEDVPADPMAAA
jgi:DNA-binding transcriptional regulator YdaS (Cro superfamily)